jgi:hypothetical protein
MKRLDALSARRCGPYIRPTMIGTCPRRLGLTPRSDLHPPPPDGLIPTQVHGRPRWYFAAHAERPCVRVARWYRLIQARVELRARLVAQRAAAALGDHQLWFF